MFFFLCLLRSQLHPFPSLEHLHRNSGVSFNQSSVFTTSIILIYISSTSLHTPSSSIEEFMPLVLPSLPSSSLPAFFPLVLLRSLNKAVKSKQDQIQRLEDEIVRDSERRTQLVSKVEVGNA